MARKTDNLRKLTRTGRSGSLAIIIPAEIIRALGWRERQRLIVKKIAGAIVIRDAKSKHKKK